ncbi:catechol 2,3-dioxygenase-like lactoylglutathione lyase family enzyme [Parvibaculum indicum]|uniref:bleomycin resistance protein n=1 Tax=Parvibaculum indicum TaxID=562969 RepID=UPI001424779E|nr:VOC family protein [Parvibaculum indicum]NIJ42232.1 catechol 2,3-dioxygenase-like lactoylglutathione lyase family enzyme [Parvibaculum indicum]
MSVETPAIVPELDVTDLEASLKVYTEVFTFKVLYSRPKERFAYLTLGNAHLMLEELAGPGRRFHTAAMVFPFGRGMNLQIEVPDVRALYTNAQASGLAIHVPLEERWYRQGDREAGNLQFVVADPDGYLLRFFSNLGKRPL